MLNQTVFDDNLKKEVEKFLVDKILNGLAVEQIDLKEMKAAANDILDNIEGIKTYDQFLHFLEFLKNKHPIVTDVYNLYKNRFHQDKEKEVIDKLSDYIKNIPKTS